MASQKCFSRHEKFFLSTVFILLLCSYTQGQGSISGKIKDAQTKEDIQYANVFLAGTMIGTSSNSDGTYLIKNIPNGKYDLTVSFVGYRRASYSISITSESAVVHFELVPEATSLHAVTVTSGPSDYNKYYPIFEKMFLGETPNSKHCTIVNPKDIYVSYEKETHLLTAVCDKPIEILNPSLGYRLFFLLEEFEYDMRRNRYKVFGIPRFEDLIPKNDKQLSRWYEERNRAYAGSVNHFFRSVVTRSLRKNHFRIAIVRDGRDHAVGEEMLLPDSTNNVIRFKGALKVVYDAEQEDAAYTYNRYFTPQTSRLEFLDDSVTVYANGYFENRKSIMLDGYLAWSEAMGDMVPLEFQPITRKKQ